MKEKGAAIFAPPIQPGIGRKAMLLGIDPLTAACVVFCYRRSQSRQIQGIYF